MNVAGTHALVRLCVDAGVRRFVFTSTTALYGAASSVPGRASWVNETTVPAPMTIYHRTKLAAEETLEHAAAAADLCVTVPVFSGGKVVATVAAAGGGDLRSLEDPDVVLLTGGTDGGNSEVLLAAARDLVASGWAGPVVVAGNVEAQADVASILGDVPHVLADNVVPRIGVLAPDSARATIRVHDGTHAAESGVLVRGRFGPNGSTLSCTTGAAGACTLKRDLKRTRLSIDFVVLGLSKEARAYLPASNHDADGESNGTEIVVTRP